MNKIETITLYSEDRQVIVNTGSPAEDHYRALGFGDKPAAKKPARRTRKKVAEAGDE